MQELASSRKISIVKTELMGKTHFTNDEIIAKMEQIVMRTKDETRIYVFIGERVALFDFVTTMDQMNLLKDQVDPYFVLAADTAFNLDEEQSCQKYIRIPDWEKMYNMSMVHSAFRSVMLVLPAHRDIKVDSKYRYVESTGQDTQSYSSQPCHQDCHEKHHASVHRRTIL